MKNFYDKFKIFRGIHTTFSNLKERLTKDVKIVPVIDEEMKKTLEEMKELSKEKDEKNTIQAEKLQTQTDIIQKLSEENLSKTKSCEELLIQMGENSQKNYDFMLNLLKITIAVSVISAIISTCVLIYVADNLNNKFDDPFEDIIESLQIL